MFSKLSTTAALVAAIASPALAIVEHGFTSDQLRLVRQRLIDGAHASWELGTAVQGLLEIDSPALTPFGVSPFPPPYALNITSPVITIAGEIVDTKPVGLMSLMEDGAAADPASNGIGVLLANWTHPETTKYLEAAEDQINFLLYNVPRGENGEISHRTEQVQLWADYISMVPPLLAYYGALQPGTDAESEFLFEAYNQIKLYRDALRDPETGLWHHVLWGSWSDPGFWATGQGWAAYGILRVQQSIVKSTLKDELAYASEDLLEWAEEIVAATWKYQQPDGSFNNYLDRQDSFRDMSSTVLMAATTYRLAVLTNATEHVPFADKAFELAKTLIDEDGWLLDVVDPYGFTIPGQHSPEGQAFVLQLQAAFRDYQNLINGIGGSLGSVLAQLVNVAALAKAN